MNYPSSSSVPPNIPPPPDTVPAGLPDGVYMDPLWEREDTVLDLCRAALSVGDDDEKTNPDFRFEDLSDGTVDSLSVTAAVTIVPDGLKTNVDDLIGRVLVGDDDGIDIDLTREDLE